MGDIIKVVHQRALKALQLNSACLKKYLGVLKTVPVDALAEFGKLKFITKQHLQNDRTP